MNKRLKFMWDTRKQRKAQSYYLVTADVIIHNNKKTISVLHISRKGYPDFSPEALHIHIKNQIRKKYGIKVAYIYIVNYQEISYHEWKSLLRQRQMQKGKSSKEAETKIYKQIKKYRTESPLYKTSELNEKM